MANRSGPAVLQVYIFKDGEYLGTDIFAERQIVIGRDPDEASLVLESAQVSRKHAIIELDGGNVRLRDAGSTNGVFVNEARVTDPVTIGRLDEIKIGEYTLKLKVQGKGGAKMEADETVGTGAGLENSTSIMPAGQAADIEQRSARAGAARAAKPAAASPRAGLDEAASRPRQSPAPDLSEFDDVGDDEPATSQRSPKAEFRKRGAPVDGDGLDDMLQGIGIESRRSPQADVETRTNVRKPEKPDRDDSTDKVRKKKANGASKPAFDELRAPKTQALEEDAAFGGGGTSVDAATSLPSAFDESTGDESRPIPDGNEFDDALSDELAAPPASHDDDDHDDEDEGPDWQPSYSLAKHILIEEAPLKGGVPRVEIVALRGDLVDHVVLLEPGESYWIGPSLPFFQRFRGAPPRFQMVKYKKNRTLEVEFRQNAEGHVVRNAQQVALSAVQAKRGRSQMRRGTSVMGLSRGEVMQVSDGPITYSVREVVAPAPARDERPLKERLTPDRALMRSAGGALGSHLFFALFFGLLTSGPKAEPTVQKEEFIEVSVEQEMKLEEPPPEPVKEEVPPPPETPPAEKIPPKAEAAPKKIKQQKVGGTSPAPAGVLGLLNKTGSSAAPGPATAVAAISNLAAAKVPSGTSGYKVSGLIGKMPTSELSLGGGGGGPMTKGAAALLRGGAGGAGALSGQGTRAVGGLVQKVPQQMRAAGQGTLDRDEIQKVINKNISQIQRCYERELLKTAGLQGKVQVEWTVAMSGAVKSARQKFSDMNNTNVVNCILGAIKGWQFPQPKGGEVVVSYPFIFKPIGF